MNTEVSEVPTASVFRAEYAAQEKDGIEIRKGGMKGP
jgi:hypothetical protein